MDSLASTLQMSKRTLYEIFGSKEEMFKEVHKYFHHKIIEQLRKTFDSSTNVMEAIIKCFLINRDIMSDVGVEFLRDMEELASQNTCMAESHQRHNYQNLLDVLQRGVAEGYFREDVNLNIQCRMFTLQMESLKRSEELFPEDISLLEIYDSIIIGFLRGVSSAKGLEELEKFLPDFTSVVSNLNEKQ